MNETPDINAVKSFLLTLQNNICRELEQEDGSACFIGDDWDRESGLGGGITRVLTNGSIFEQAGVNFSHVFGNELPASATANRPELVGRSFQAMGVSLVIHPHILLVATAGRAGVIRVLFFSRVVNKLCGLAPRGYWRITPTLAAAAPFCP